ncbi:hypothetical protein ACIRLA_46425 [Streptomyces sp. NPDC102364]|uniref:hypothetical protein n=1 Tax=Streptomyces sp. NPDC102364 TaxID=3366161 RepID=UPI00382EB5CA
MSPKKRTAKKTTTPAPAPRTVRVQVMRRYIGSPDVGDTVTVACTPYLRKLIRAGFLRQVN